MEIKHEFIRTATRNYISIEKPTGYEDDYQMAMIMENDIKGLLKIEERMIDGKEYLYYDISSLQPIQRMYEHKGLSSDEIKNTVRNMIKALKEADDHMLDITNIVLSPLYIYTDPDDRNIYMMFYPYNTDSGSNEMTELAEFFLERIERSDADAAVFAYKFYQTVRKDNYVLADLEAIVDESFASKEREKSNASGIKEKGGGLFRADEQVNKPVGEAINICKRTPAKKDDDKKIPFAVIAGLLAVSAVVCLLVLSGVFPNVGKNPGQKIVAAALAVSFLVALIVFTVDHIRKCRHEKQDDPKPQDLILQQESSRPESSKEDIVRSDILRSDNPDQKVSDQKVSDQKVSDQNFDSFFSDLTPKAPAPKAPVTSTEDITFGKTVFLSEDDEAPDNILEDKKGKEYKIDHFPFLIGKMSDSADLVLNDRTVSRIHARITTENDHYFIQDCNSTNGTFLNGMELKGDEMAMLSKNDEIEIGHVKLSYR